MDGSGTRRTKIYVNIKRRVEWTALIALSDECGLNFFIHALMDSGCNGLQPWPRPPLFIYSLIFPPCSSIQLLLAWVAVIGSRRRHSWNWHVCHTVLELRFALGPPFDIIVFANEKSLELIRSKRKFHFKTLSKRIRTVEIYINRRREREAREEQQRQQQNMKFPRVIEN